MKITFYTMSVAALSQLIEAEKTIKSLYPGILDLRLYNSAAIMDKAKKEQLRQDILDSDFLFLDTVGISSFLADELIGWTDKARGEVIPFGRNPLSMLKLGHIDTLHGKTSIQGRGRDGASLSEAARLDLKNFADFNDYFTYADYGNILNLLYMVLRSYGHFESLPVPEKPRSLELAYYADPETRRFYDNFQDYAADFPIDGDRATIGFIFYTSSYPTDSYSVSAKVLERLRQDFNVVPIALGNSASDDERLMSLLTDAAHPPIELLINVKSFRFLGGPGGGNIEAGLKILRTLQVPYLHPFYLSKRSEEEWAESMAGCGPSEVMLFMVQPEQDGAIEIYPIAAQDKFPPDAAHGIELRSIVPIEERLEHLVERVKRHIALRRKPRDQVKLAILCYNYPPGENNMFGGAFLDTFASVENILRELKAAGYSTDAVSKEYLMDIFSTGKAVNSSNYSESWDGMIRWSDRDYLSWLDKHYDKEELIKTFGPAPGEIMSDGDEFLIPGTVIGNIFVGLQPARCNDGGVQQCYHDKTLPPPHQYIAFYQWLEQVFKADVVLHVGTHGTVELLKGKESGMSGRCYPDMLLGRIPHLYLYFCGNPSEATIAKRRTHAQLIGYQPPVFEAGQLYGDYARLSENIDFYHQSETLSPQMSEETKAKIFSMAKELNLPENLDDIERELYRMNSSLIPVGLHIIGRGFDEKEAYLYAKGLVRLSHSEAQSLRSLVAESQGLDLEDLEDRGEILKIREIDAEADLIFDCYMAKKPLPQHDYLKGEALEKVLTTLAYAEEKMHHARNNEEMACLLNALADKYNGAKLAGDIFRNPEVLPCGQNMYHMDPRLIPSDVAIRRGNAICDNTLNAYLEETGSYPKSVAVVLWGLETSRTQGETFAQVLRYLGIRPIKKRGGWDTSYEIIPIEELGRPRIDVSINICGFFRDMFGNLLEVLNELLPMIYELPESDEQNYYRANCKKTARALITEGLDENEALDMSNIRVFGPRAGEYGTPLHTIVESKSWSTEDDLGNIFMDAVQFPYGKNVHGEKRSGLYRKNLENVDVVSQVRSNPEYEITDLDHYYEYFGGLAKSVEMVSGKKAKMYISDTTNERVYTETVDKSIARGVRTRLLNPKWINGMLEHKVHGAQHIADRFENVTGFAATTGEVEDWVFEDMYDTYISDESMQKRMEENNPHAYMDILERMMELYERGYWNADESQLKNIQNIYLSLEGEIEKSTE